MNENNNLDDKTGVNIEFYEDEENCEEVEEEMRRERKEGQEEYSCIKKSK